MRWWIAVLLAVVCIVVGLLIPIPKLEYNGAFIPTEETEPPLANIGLAERAPQPLAIKDASSAKETDSFLFEGSLTAGFIDSHADLLPAKLSALSSTQDYSGIQIDPAQRKWMRINGYTISRAGCPLALLLEPDGRIAIVDIATQTKLHTFSPQELCENAALLDWDQTPSGRVAIAILDSEGAKGGMLIYDLLTGDVWTLTGLDAPRFSPDDEQLYARQMADDASVICSIALTPDGDAAESPITAPDANILSYQPVRGGLLVLASEENAGPSLALINPDGEETHRYTLPSDSANGTLYRMEPGLAWLSIGSGMYSIAVDSPTLTDIGADAVPVALDSAGNRFLLRAASEYSLMDIATRQSENVHLVY